MQALQPCLPERLCAQIFSRYWKNLRLFELAHQPGELLRGERLLERIGAGREIALRQRVELDERLARQVEDEVERVFRARHPFVEKSMAPTLPHALTQSR